MDVNNLKMTLKNKIILLSGFLGSEKTLDLCLRTINKYERDNKKVYFLTKENRKEIIDLYKSIIGG